MPVNTPNYTPFTGQWSRIRDAIAGEDAVKQKAGTYLRRPDSMSAQDFTQYAKCAVWFPATSRALSGLVGSVFRKEPKVETPDNDRLADITLSGTPFVTFAKGLTEEVLALGRGGVLVDVGTSGAPYLSRYVAESILSYRTAYIDGEQRLSMVVLREYRERPKAEDRFVTETVERIRVLELARGEGVDGLIYTVSVFEKRPNARMGEEFVLVEGPIVPTRRGQPLDFIPFVFFGPNDLSPNIEQSPLLGLVDMNFSHFKSTAEYENAVWYAGTPQLVISGRFPNAGDEQTTDISVGSQNAILLEEGGSAQMLQGAAENVGALREALEDKERRMAVLGARLLEPQQKGNPEHHQSVELRHRGEDSILANVAGTVSRGLTRCLETLYWWAGKESPKVVVELNRDFTPAAMSPDQMLKLVSSWMQGGIGGKALYHSLKNGERIPAEWTYEDYLQDLEMNGHEAVSMGFAFDNRKKELN